MFFVPLKQEKVGNSISPSREKHMRIPFTRTTLLALFASATGSAAFQASPSVARTSLKNNGVTTTAVQMATIDRNSVITSKELSEIKGDDLTPEEINKRLENRSFRYPKHVEVISDFDSVVDNMVDKIVSFINLSLFT